MASARVYGEADPREMPIYTVGEAARYLRLSASTVRNWTSSNGVIRPARRARPRSLSFSNVVEVHVLSSIREHVSLQKVRKALSFLRREFDSKRPFIEEQFATGGSHLFVERYGALINVSEEGQVEMREVMQLYLTRIDRDTSGLAIRLFPFVGRVAADAPRVVAIDPRVSFGRPTVEGTGIPTREIAERFKAGDSLDALSDDFELESSQVQDAIRCELGALAA